MKSEVFSDEFPSPQGGSETHPLKGCGGEPPEFPSPQGGSETDTTLLLRMPKEMRFHPLKAGRRRPVGFSPDGAIFLVSIPSRRVGDPLRWKLERRESRVSIPSRRVGDVAELVGTQPPSLVSIPSRRVGDDDQEAVLAKLEESFHPLKAGRRRSRRARH